MSIVGQDQHLKVSTLNHKVSALDLKVSVCCLQKLAIRLAQNNIQVSQKKTPKTKVDWEGSEATMMFTKVNRDSSQHEMDEAS